MSFRTFSVHDGGTAQTSIYFGVAKWLFTLIAGFHRSNGFHGWAFSASPLLGRASMSALGCSRLATFTSQS